MADGSFSIARCRKSAYTHMGESDSDVPQAGTKREGAVSRALVVHLGGSRYDAAGLATPVSVAQSPDSIVASFMPVAIEVPGSPPMYEYTWPAASVSSTQ
jgi:hypothetical protein